MRQRNHGRNLGAVVVAAMLVLAIGAVPAAAKKGGGNGGPPGGGKPELVGQTCAEYYGAATPVVWQDAHTFVLTISSPDYPCVDIETPAGTWVVKVDVGSAREVSVQLRSSVPGDWCWSEHVRASTTLYLDAPASAPNACPIPGIAGEDSIQDDADPLAFTVYAGKKPLKTPVIVTVTLPAGT